MTSYNIIVYHNYKYEEDYPLIITPGGFISSKWYEEKERKKTYSDKIDLSNNDSILKFLKVHILSGFSDGYKPKFPDVVQITNYCYLLTSDGFLRVKFNDKKVASYLHPFRIL